MIKLASAAAVCAALVVAGAPLAGGTATARPAAAVSSSQQARPGKTPGLPGGFKHLVVIYEENHSFDNLYGGWGAVNGQRVNGRSHATTARTAQVDQDGTPYSCLLQNDVNLTSPPQPSDCTDSTDSTHTFTSHFTNKPFAIDRFIKPADTTCPAPGVFAANGVPKGSGEPGGCTRDIVHRFYQEQYQLNGGRQNRYTTGSDAVGLTQGYYKTRDLPIYKYLHRTGAPKYVLADRFFQAAFGGSFLNHQWLIAARTPLDTSHNAGLPATTPAHSVLDSNGMVKAYPLYKPTGSVNDGPLTRRCNDPLQMKYKSACGDFAVNTVQPSSPPAAATGAKIPLIDDAKYPNIGDRMTKAGISWKWYSGGWRDATSGKPGPLFQYHHQPFNYFADLRPRAARPRAPQGRVAVHHGREERPPPDGQLREAVRRRERAPGLRQPVDGQRPPRRPAQDDHQRPPGEGHPGRGDLRRVRRAVGPRVAPGRGSQEGHPRRVGSGHPHPGPGDRSLVEALGRRPHVVRHDVDPGDHRAKLRARAAVEPRPGRQRPLPRRVAGWPLAFTP